MKTPPEPQLITVQTIKQLPAGFHTTYAVADEAQALRILKHSGADVGYYKPSGRYLASQGLLVIVEAKDG